METAFKKYQEDLKAEEDKKKAAAAMVAASLSGASGSAGSAAAAAGSGETGDVVDISDEDNDPDTLQPVLFTFPKIPPTITSDAQVVKYFKTYDWKLPKIPNNFASDEALVEQFNNVVPVAHRIKLLSNARGVKAKNKTIMWET